MDKEIIVIFAVLILGFIYLQISKRQKKKKAKKLLILFLNYLEDYKIEIQQRFDEYLITNRIIIFENKERKIISTNKYNEAEIGKAFSYIKSRFSNDFNEDLYLFGEEVKSERLNFLDSIFNSVNKKDKLHFVNKKIELYAIDLAVEKYYYDNSNNRNVSLGSEYIALNAFYNETLLEYHYPEKNYQKLKNLLKYRKKEPNLSFEEFLKYYQYEN